MSQPLSRRRLLAGGLAALGGSAVAAKLADRYDLIPPDWGGVWGPGETLTYACQRLLTHPHAMAREFSREKISKVAPISGRPPKAGPYRQALDSAFSNWRLRVDGLVDRPAAYSLADLKHLPSRSQITEQTCEEGWCFIAEWTGPQLSYVLNLAGVQPRARWVVAFAMDEGYDSIDLQDAWHPQTLIAHSMNGEFLTPDRGAPVRLSVPRQLGYKSLKFLSHILVTDTVKNIGKGLGSWQPEGGYSWYAGI